MTRDTCIWKCFPRGILRLSFLTVSSSGHSPQSSKGTKLLLASRVPMCLTSLLLECAAAGGQGGTQSLGVLHTRRGHSGANAQVGLEGFCFRHFLPLVSEGWCGLRPALLTNIPRRTSEVEWTTKSRFIQLKEIRKNSV